MDQKSISKKNKTFVLLDVWNELGQNHKPEYKETSAFNAFKEMVSNTDYLLRAAQHDDERYAIARIIPKNKEHADHSFRDPLAVLHDTENGAILTINTEYNVAGNMHPENLEKVVKDYFTMVEYPSLSNPAKFCP